MNHIIQFTQYLLDEYCDCHMGNMLPALRSRDQQPHDSSSHDESHDRAEEEVSDSEIMQRDVIEVPSVYVARFLTLIYSSKC